MLASVDCWRRRVVRRGVRAAALDGGAESASFRGDVKGFEASSCCWGGGGGLPCRLVFGFVLIYSVASPREKNCSRANEVGSRDASHGM